MTTHFALSFQARQQKLRRRVETTHSNSDQDGGTHVFDQTEDTQDFDEQATKEAMARSTSRNELGAPSYHVHLESIQRTVRKVNGACSQ
jgi:hypothetical protein